MSPRPSTRRPTDERGAVTVWVLIVIGGLIGVFAGLAYDAGNAANRHVEVADAAWALARTAAAETARSDSGLVIDEDAARAAVSDLATNQWPDFTWSLVVFGDSATVRVTGDYRTRILKAVGVSEWSFTADRTAIATNSG